MHTYQKKIALLSLLVYFVCATIFSIVVLQVNVPRAEALSKEAALEVCERKQDPAACRTRVNRCPNNTTAEANKCRRDAVRVGPASADASNDEKVPTFAPKGTKPYKCGYGPGVEPVSTRFNLGCLGTNPPGDGKSVGPIEDMVYAFVKLLSLGVGLVLIASVIYAGIQYASSSGNPEKTAAAKTRILNAFVGLIFYLLIFALIQWLVPGGLFAG